MSAAFHMHDLRRGVPEKLEALVAPHIDSFDYFVERGLPEAVRLIEPVEIHDPSRKLRFKAWLENPQLMRPYSDDGLHRPVYPTECRQSGTTYHGDLRMDLCLTHYDEKDDVADADVASGGIMVQRIPCNFGHVPIMVKSSLCHLRNLSQEQLVKRKEESLEMGGYFICNGIERLIRLLILPKRNYPMAIQRSSLLRKGVGFSNKAISMRCVRSDQTSLTQRLVYVNDGTANLNFSLRKREYFVPVGIVMKALVEISDAELYSLITEVLPPSSSPSSSPPTPAAGTSSSPAEDGNSSDGNSSGDSSDGSDSDEVLSGESDGESEGKGESTAGRRSKGGNDLRQQQQQQQQLLGTAFVRERAMLLLNQARTHGLFTRTQCVAFLGERFRAAMEFPEHRSNLEAGERFLKNYILVHVHHSDKLQKLRLLVLMLHKLYAFVDGTAQEDNADALQHHELLLPGHLLTMFVKERLQGFLSKLQKQAQKELLESPGRVDLRSQGWVRKVLDKSLVFVGHDVEYLLNTGNLSSQTGLDLQQKSGFTLVAEKLNFLRYLSHFRSVHRGAFFAELRTTTVRKLLPESWGFLCPVHTPDGSPCGLLNHLAAACVVTTDLLDPSAGSGSAVKSAAAVKRSVLRHLCARGMHPLRMGMPAACARAPPEFLVVMVDGEIVGHMHHSLVEGAVDDIRRIKVCGDDHGIPKDLEIAHIPFSPMGTYPGLFLFSSPARFVRPVKQCPPLCHTTAAQTAAPLAASARGQQPQPGQELELIGPLEQVFMDIRCPDGSSSGGSSSRALQQDAKAATAASSPAAAAAAATSEYEAKYKHEEVHPTSIFSVVASLTPWSDYNQSPRNMYQCQMGKQTMGMPLHSFPYRVDNKLYRLQTPQTPIARTAAYDAYCMDDFPTGTNAVVAVLAYTGYDMEDAMIINKASMERGFGHGFVYKTEEVEANPKMAGSSSASQSALPNVFKRARQQHANTIDTDGLPKVGQRLKPDDAYCSTANVVTGQPNIHKLKGTEEAVVDGVALLGMGVPKHAKGIQKATIRMRYGRRPQIGDKFSSRHGQKGVLSQLWPDEDMPFSNHSGMRPDIIINPHAFPSRMTIGMLVESMASKSGALHGYFVNASTFRNCTPHPDPLIRPGPHRANPPTLEEGPATAAAHSGKTGDTAGARDESNVVAVFGEELVAKGFNYFGTETMYSGVYGTEMDCHIYMGLVYYQRLRHMVSDKFQVRSTGAVNPLTQQPVKGRSRGGGIRFGEMERDALLSHGAAFLLHDRLHVCSDYHTADVCSLCGSVLSPVLGVPSADGAGVSSSSAALAAGLMSPGGVGVGPALGASGDLVSRSKRMRCMVCGSGKGLVRIAMPFVFRYLAVELAAMNIKLTLAVK